MNLTEFGVVPSDREGFSLFVAIIVTFTARNGYIGMAAGWETYAKTKEMFKSQEQIDLRLKAGSLLE